MKTRTWFIALALVIACAAIPQAEEAQEKGRMMDPGMEAMMQKFAEYGTPGSGHKALNSLIGHWNAKVEHKMSSESEPEVSEGASESEWIMDGRFVQQTYNGEAMGAPFTGMGIIGYDNLTNQYNSIWLDSMGTGIMVGTGSFDEVSRSISESGNFSCPMTGSTRDYRSVTTIIDDNHYNYESFMKDESGNEFRAVLITYVRQASEEIAGNIQEKE